MHVFIWCILPIKGNLKESFLMHKYITEKHQSVLMCFNYTSVCLCCFSMAWMCKLLQRGLSLQDSGCVTVFVTMSVCLHVWVSVPVTGGSALEIRSSLD